MKTALARFLVYLVACFVVRIYLIRQKRQEKRLKIEDLRLNKSLETLSEQYEKLCYKEDEVAIEIDKALSSKDLVEKKPHKWYHTDFERLSALHGFRNNELFIEHLAKDGIIVDYDKTQMRYTLSHSQRLTSMQRYQVDRIVNNCTKNVPFLAYNGDGYKRRQLEFERDMAERQRQAVGQRIANYSIAHQNEIAALRAVSPGQSLNQKRAAQRQTYNHDLFGIRGFNRG